MSEKQDKYDKLDGRLDSVEIKLAVIETLLTNHIWHLTLYGKILVGAFASLAVAFLSRMF